MEIPYIVKPRKDTGLFNSKIAIWLFLASEVMLFGGFFSAYVFMRIGADYPWPERTLPVLPGLINTFILIASSVTVVFAWAALKLRKWRQFQVFMSITVLCAVVFMCLKAVEYSVKFKHQAVRLDDYSIIEGHLAYEKDEKGEYVKHKGHKVEHNQIIIDAQSVTFSTTRYHKPWVEAILEQAGQHGAKLVLAADVKGSEGLSDAEKTYAGKGDALSVELLETIKKQHLKARAHNQKLRTAALRQEWRGVKDANPGKRGWQLSDQVQIDADKLKPELLTEISAVTFTVEPNVHLEFKPRDIREEDGSSRLRDDTVINGKLLESPMVFENVDAIDFQYLAMKAVEKGIDPMDAINNSWVIRNFPFAKEAWEWHCGEIAKLEKELEKDYGYDKQGKPKREPTLKERYRMGWKELAKWAEQEKRSPELGFLKGTVMEEFKGPNYHDRGQETFPELSVPRSEIAFASKFVPAWNTYYAIYFTITGIHGLHVIGGALVLAYYLFFGRRMYETNPEWLANRVEVGGLFWHFVDLVWIFAFPIFYLM